VTGDDAVDRFWADYVATSRATGPHTAWGFAEPDPDLMTELALLVRDGPKRATTTIEAAFAEDGEPLPRVGDHAVILDGNRLPVCIIRTTTVEIRAFGQVDEAYAWDEGEGDRSLASWRRGHEWFFASIGTPVGEDTPVVLEWFAKVWPPPADPGF
jgi:uncharacterized protein YhfF